MNISYHTRYVLVTRHVLRFKKMRYMKNVLKNINGNDSIVAGDCVYYVNDPKAFGLIINIGTDDYVEVDWSNDPCKSGSEMMSDSIEESMRESFKAVLDFPDHMISRTQLIHQMKDSIERTQNIQVERFEQIDVDRIRITYRTNLLGDQRSIDVKIE